MMALITKKQAEYIQIMVSGRFGTAEDTRMVSQYLAQVGKEKVADLTMNQASTLISQLLAREVKYEFLCGKTKIMKRDEGHRLDIFGEFEACMDHCPEEVYFGTCEHFLAYEKAIYEDQEME
jgi:hypothetical protein